MTGATGHNEPQIVAHPDADLLAEAVAARLLTRIIDAQASRGTAAVALTGGGMGTAALAALARNPARDAIDWGRLDLWWSDERFVPSGHAERNETGARQALLDHVSLDPERVHPMPAAGGDDAQLEFAAQQYAAELATAAQTHGDGAVPAFDVVLLGVGPDGHVASLFPGSPALNESQRTVVGVPDAPKPPPTRISLTFAAINAASAVWLLVGGSEKAPAVRRALIDGDIAQTPAAGVRGRHRTLWLLDRPAASELNTQMSESQ